MYVMVCVDDRNGMMFNGRRQSKDRAVIEDMEKMRADRRFFMNKYSDKMFAAYGFTDHETFDSTEQMLAAAGEGDYCFLEDMDPAVCMDRVKRIVIYRWNRHYPSDLRLKEDFLIGWERKETVEFTGTSHEKITREIFERA